MITYIARNTLNGKFYIGSTFDLKKRKRQHLRNKNNYPFQNALRKNENAFEWEIIEDNYDEPILEQALLDIWVGKEQCYNLNPYANRPSLESSIKNGKYVYENKIGIFSEEYITSEKYIEHQRTAGKLAGEKVAKERIGFANPEYIKSEEYRQIRVRNGSKLSENKMGMFSEEYKNSPERKEMEYKRLKKISKSVLLINPNGNKISFSSCRDAERNMGMCRRIISRLAKKGTPATKGKWKGWKVIYQENLK